MSESLQPRPEVALACGGTGGHLFPGLAIAEQLLRRGSAVRLLVSPKEVDQVAVRQAVGMEVLTLPAIGLTRGQVLAFMRGFARSYRATRSAFAAHPPAAALAMGGFTGAPPLLAARRLGAPVFLHESNTVPGRANRWLARLAERAFVGFPSAASRLRPAPATVTGTPVRRQFVPRNAHVCRAALGLEPDRPVVLVMGGSQGASAINQLVRESLPLLSGRAPDWQWLHLAGRADADSVRSAYAALNLRARVHPFLAEMELALGAATASVSRAGASCLAEFAATRVPAVLVPLPSATDNHQFHNACAYADTGAALLLEQENASPGALLERLERLVRNPAAREAMQSALAAWDRPLAAEQIAEAILAEVELRATTDRRRAAGEVKRGSPPSAESLPFARVPSRVMERGLP